MAASHHRVTLEDALSRIPATGSRYAKVLTHDQWEVGLYAPRGEDPQTPHNRDEAYVVVSGSGTFVNGDERSAFGPGDMLFVPAGVVHRFEDFTDDLTVWVIFHGPEKRT